MTFNAPLQTPSAKVHDLLIEKFFPSVRATGRSPAPDVSPSRRFQNREYAGKRSSLYDASRKRVVESIRNLKGWWYVETPNYIVLSNLRSGNQQLVKDVQDLVEQARALYEKMIPPRGAVDAVSVIRIPATQEEFTEYVGPDFTWAAGVWMRDRKELVVRVVEWGRNEHTKANVLHVVGHEAFHQYVESALNGHVPGAWFNEGHAEFCSQLDFKHLKPREETDSLPTLENIINSDKFSIKQLIGHSYEEFYARQDSDSTMQMYSLAWGFIYYLRTSAAVDHPDTYGVILDRYADVLAETGDPVRANASAFEGVDMNALRDDFAAFWKSQKRRRAAERARLVPEPDDSRR